MIQIYVHKITPRIRYIFKTVFKTYFGINSYKLVTNEEEFTAFEGNKFSYSNKPLKGEFNVTSSAFLFETGIKEQNISLGEWEGVITLFSKAKNEKIPFDIFSAIFFCLTRYEEYLPHVRDKYERFIANDSLAAKKGFLQTAVVDRWVIKFQKLLKAEFPELEFAERKFKYLPTIDIDNAYAYKHKGILRTVGSLGRSLLQLRFSELAIKVAVLLGRRKDPFDTYNYQLNVQKRYNLKPLYFILIGDYGLNDKNLSYENKYFKQLVKTISDYAHVGIHPSFGSTRNPEKLKVEIKRLEFIIKSDILKSRQHFLKLSLPETYRHLLDADIEEDYTMGYASELGFRAGTCTPYPFYDLDEEVECKLIVYPFQVMESTLKYYKNCTAPEAIDKIKEIVDEVKAVNGLFISLWHNESLSDEKEWKGWRNVYEEMTDYTLKLTQKKP